MAIEVGGLSMERQRPPRGSTILEVRDLHTEFDTEQGIVHAVDGVSFDVRAGETLAIVGESGCGKTVTALSILGLLPHRQGRISAGRVLFHGEDLVPMTVRQLNTVRGERIAMIFQDALTALNPVYRVGKQIAEMILAHRDVSKKEALDRAVELLDLVGIPNAAKRANDYVHQFSGGMRQRAMIAMAIALEPEILIADEPTTALDVTVQAQVLDVIQEIGERMDMSIILITHDLGVVARISDRVMVMYAGRNIETADTHDIYHGAKHPYAWGLLESMPRVDAETGSRLHQIGGAPPSLIDPPRGCRFAPRCMYAQTICEADYPEIQVVGGSNVVCHFAARPDWTPALDPTDLRAALTREGGS
jgi:oligopeptide/dipeptide ABC transporter ATP-binding protein